MSEIIECVPNVSEGRRKDVLDALRSTVAEVPGVTLLDLDPDPSHNRAVFTFVGRGAAVSEAAFRLARRAAELIDLNHHKGEHPRMGATDVIPFVPVEGATMADCVALARRLGERIGRELSIPVFLYGEAASRPDRRNLPDVRKGEFEGLRDAIGKDPSKDPDFGPRAIHPTAGAVAVGARPFLIAYNVNLKSRDVALAKAIASKVREKDGGLPSVRALGFELADRGLVQVSMNLVDFTKTPPAAAFAAVAREAASRGAEVHGSEVVGLVPLAALPPNALRALRLEGFSAEQILEVKVFGTSDAGLNARVAAVMGATAGEGGKSLEPFLDALASGEPTPGGGAAAAAMGALGASLALMCCRLPVDKPEFQGRRAMFEEIARVADRLQRRFTEAVDEDVQAYNAVVAALKLPRATPEEKAARSAALQKAFKWATNVPLQVAEMAADTLDLLEPLSRNGLPGAISDVGVGAKAARAAFDGASYNVLINLGSIKDPAFASQARARLEAARARAEKLSAAIDDKVRQALA